MKYITLLVLVSLVVVVSPVHAGLLDSLPSIQKYVPTNLNVSGTSSSVPDIKGLLNTNDLNSGNLFKMLKAVAVLAINLFLIVIQVVVGILKALLPFLN